jgi:hypothetical protein
VAAAVREPRPGRAAVKRILFPLVIFAIAFGYAEAMQVVYMRALAVPVRVHLGLAPDDLFPLPPVDQLGPLRRLVPLEQLREAATMLMLAAVGGLIGRDRYTWFAATAFLFGVWDLAYYGWLRILLGWPSSVLDWDVLFLLPIPWAAPVLAVLISAASLVCGGAIALLHPPERVSKLAWLLLWTSAALMLLCFTWDWRSWLSGGMPRNFPWTIFVAAEILAVAGFLASRTWGGPPGPQPTPSSASLS